MRKFKIGLFILLALLFIPTLVSAEEDDWEDYTLEGETTKYFKTITHYNVSLNPTEIMNVLGGNSYSETIEITEEEYEMANVAGMNSYNLNDMTVIETTYKKMITQLYSYGSGYRYKNQLVWKNFPSVRSYDIIAIGYYPSVTINGSVNFIQSFCVTGDGCYSNSNDYPQQFVGGISTVFKLPVGTLNSLDETIYFNVKKNTTSTIIEQVAAGDYSHATTSTALLNAVNHSVIQDYGIALDSSIISNYDSMTAAVVHWYGSW